MSGLIVLRTEIKKGNLNKFLEINSSWTIGIAKIYHMGDIIEVIYNVELMGYCEPLDYYNDVKDYVVDVWYCIVGDVDLKKGKDVKGDKWWSCKKEVKEKNG